MLPFYPPLAILIGYTLSILFKHKNLIINILFLSLLIFWYKQTADEIKRLHHTRKNLSTNITWEQKILDNTTKDDTIIYTKEGEHYFGGLRKQPLDYYWFNIGGLAYLDYLTFHRHPFPDLRKTIILHRPKIVFNGYWDNYLGRNQTLDKDYMQKHYIDKGIFYLRKD